MEEGLVFELGLVEIVDIAAASVAAECKQFPIFDENPVAILPSYCDFV